MTVSDSVDVAATPEQLWTQVADPAQMPRWSPENTGAPVGAGKPLGVGETFHGTNKRGAARWTTSCTVTASEPGKVFAFDVTAIGIKNPRMRGRIARWSYSFEPSAAGTTVTETWTDLRTGWPDWAAAAFDKVATRGSLFSDFQRRNIAKTLKNLQADFTR
ncbi:MAG: SRPBCC family protein [Marmoricola sp.]